MLEFRRIVVDDKEKMQEYLDLDGAFMTERCFANLFVWSEYYKIKVCFTENTMYLCSSHYKDYFLAFPPFTKGDFKRAVLNMLEFSNDHHEIVKFNTVSSKQREKMEKIFGKDAFTFTENRDSMDYIYSGSDLMMLHGKKFSQKRNHINKFMSEYEDTWSYEDIDIIESYDDIVKFQIEWCLAKGDKDCESLPETLAIIKTLDYFKELDLSGGILRINGKMVAFTIGVKVSDILFDVFFEKANSDINGAYAMINQQFAQNNFEGIDYINREEDMGIDGLRQAKMSYNPLELTMKYIAEPNLDCIYKR